MLELTINDINDIENQMFNKSRDIDVCLFNYLRGDFPQEMIVDALSMYQNKDGGFGHGLDPDNLNPDSTSYETSVAFEYFTLMGYKSYKDSPELEAMLNKIFNYLYNKNPEWNMFEEANLKYACAERFRVSSNSIALKTNIIANTLLFLDDKKPYFKMALSKLEKLFKEYIGMQEITLEEALCFKKLELVLDKVNTNHEEVSKHMNQLIENLVKSTTLQSSNAYYIAQLDESRRNDALDLIIESRKKHGLWETEFEWGNTYPEAESAKLKWLGAITVKNYAILKKFKRIMEN